MTIEPPEILFYYPDEINVLVGRICAEIVRFLLQAPHLADVYFFYVLIKLWYGANAKNEVQTLLRGLFQNGGHFEPEVVIYQSMWTQTVISLSLQCQ